jgi:integrase
VRHYSPRTERTYVGWVVRFIHFHEKRHPREMGPREVEGFVTHLATVGKVSSSTQRQALSAILFLYRNVLKIDLELDRIPRAKIPKKLPVVLTRGEVRAIVGQLSGRKWLMMMLLYGAGLRLLECARLRVKDLDFERNQIMVRAGKGNRDRATVLPQAVKASLREHLRAVKKKMKSKGFAASVNRDDIRNGAEQLGVELDEQITFVLEALRGIAGRGWSSSHGSV